MITAWSIAVGFNFFSLNKETFCVVSENATFGSNLPRALVKHVTLNQLEKGLVHDIAFFC